MDITYADAQDPQMYRRAKAKAVALGEPLIVGARLEAAPAAAPANAVIVPLGADSQTYRRLKAQAEAAGSPLVFAEHLPPAA